MTGQRGTPSNPANRFTDREIEVDLEGLAAAALAAGDDAIPAPRTRFFEDASRTILSENDSPDLPFDVSVNPYRGCEHGCSYCYARPTHEYLGLSAGLDFETQIIVKREAPALLRAELMKRSWRPRLLALSGVTDCYQPVERVLRITRGCLEVLAEFRNPVGIVTKNALVTRDADVLARLAEHDAVQVFVSVTTLDADLAGELEPRASRPRKRLEAIAELARAGIPVGVLVAPVIPGLTDHEMPSIVAAAKEAGATMASWQLLRLPHGVKQLFDDWLALHRPLRRDKVLDRVRELRGGALNDSTFVTRFRGEGEWARQLEQLFKLALARAGLSGMRAAGCSTAAFRRPGPQQRGLFGGGVARS
ncbi:MAG: PA0069 family radical SAM protein [Planctomycetes bacterium]|nr:PA0069 family radical SAM protein [Planctomycetota bacterium]